MKVTVALRYEILEFEKVARRVECDVEDVGASECGVLRTLLLVVVSVE